MRILVACVGAALAGVAGAVETSVDFTRETGRLRPALHSSGWTPRSSVRGVSNDDEIVKSMNLTYARTHDWALVNSAQRVVDYQYVFPLFEKDAKDPSNYVFGPTDHLLQLSRNVGLKTFYRLGTSIEHSGSVHFNAAVPNDFNQVAEIFAGIMRHYNRGFANGKKWNIEYWEIWNEPDGIDNMWCDPVETRVRGKDKESDEAYDAARAKRLRASFIRFFVTCLRRLKSEFPEVKIGGPALCWFNEDYFRELLSACKEAGIAPDFISWHYYGSDANAIPNAGDAARKLCDSFGFTNAELVVDEWHFIPQKDKNGKAALARYNDIEAACYELAALSRLQTSKIDQAYYYGCRFDGKYGFKDHEGKLYKTYYAMKLFGDVLKDYPRICGLRQDSTLTALGLKSEDGKRLALLVTDYRGEDHVLKVAVKGAENVKCVTAVALDETRDLEPVDVQWSDSELTIVKPSDKSAAYLISFER